MGREKELNQEKFMMTEQPKKIKDFFDEILSLRNLNLEKLANMTNIPKNYLVAFCEGDFKKLPPMPYSRGYLFKIAEVLEIDGEELWKIYKNEIASQIKVPDRLPINRFAGRPFGKKIIAIGIISVFAIIYLILRADDFLGVPKIEIIVPAGEKIIVYEPLIKLSGRVNNFRDKLTLGGEEIFISEDGRFEKEYWLQAGINTVEFKIKRFLGKETKIVKEIIYQP